MDNKFQWNYTIVPSSSDTNLITYDFSSSYYCPCIDDEEDWYKDNAEYGQWLRTDEGWKYSERKPLKPMRSSLKRF